MNDFKINLLLRRVSKSMDNAGTSLIHNASFILIIVLLAIITDTITIRSVFENNMVDNVLLSNMATIMAAFILDATPVLIASFIHSYAATGSRKALLKAVFLSLVFIGFFILLFVLRWKTRYSTFVSINDTGLTNSVGSAAAVAADGERNENIDIFTVFLGLLPLFTSMLTFFVSLDNPPKSIRRRELLKSRRNIVSAISKLSAERDELDRDWQKLLSDEDEIMFTSAIDNARAVFGSELERFRLKLAIVLKKPTFISMLTEPRLSVNKSSVYGFDEFADAGYINDVRSNDDNP